MVERNALVMISTFFQTVYPCVVSVCLVKEGNWEDKKELIKKFSFFDVLASFDEVSLKRDGGVPLAMVAGVEGIGVVGGLTQAGDYANTYFREEKDGINLWTVSENLTC